MTTTDSYYEIGSTHIVCEDYAITGNGTTFDYAILSDGCSSSSRVDIGARLLCHAAEEALHHMARIGILHERVNMPEILKALIVKKCLELRAIMCLDPDAFDATLVIALNIREPFRQSVTIAWGDGVIVTKGDRTIVTDLEYTESAPYYLSYKMSQERNKAYNTQFARQNKTVSEFCLEDVDQDNATEEEVNLLHTYVKWYNSVESISDICIFSDGIKTYKYDPKLPEAEGKVDNISLQEILTQVLDFKNPTGQFVIRKFNNRIKKDMRKKGIVHWDDISCACIHL